MKRERERKGKGKGKEGEGEEKGRQALLRRCAASSAAVVSSVSPLYLSWQRETEGGIGNSALDDFLQKFAENARIEKMG